MKYELIEMKILDITNRNIALIKRGKKYPEYAVVRNLDMTKPMESDEQWDLTIEYYNPTISGRSNLECLQAAIDCYRAKTEENYISRERLDVIFKNMRDYIYDYFENADAVDKELIDYLGLEENEISLIKEN